MSDKFFDGLAKFGIGLGVLTVILAAFLLIAKILDITKFLIL